VVAAFKVRYATTYAQAGSEGDVTFAEVAVEAEPIFHAYQTKAHRENVEMYQTRGKGAESYPASGY
jgi:hypothetical protein